MPRTSFLLCLLGLLAACQKQQKNKTIQRESPPIYNVETELATSFEGQTTLRYSGLVEARETTPLSFKTAGTVVQLLVEEGQFVKKGQLLAQLDDTNAKNAYELAIQKQQQARDAYDRMQPMHANGTLPAIKWVEVETSLKQAKTAAAMAKKRIADNQLYAPKSGVIGDKNVLLGMNVLPATTAFDLLNIHTIYVNIPVPENEIGQLKKGKSVAISIGAIDKEVVGKIHQIGVVADRMAHTYPAKVLVNNADWQIKPGMVCAAKMAGQKSISGVLVSNKALQKNPLGERYVFVLDGDKASKQTVQTLDLVDNKVLVTGIPADTEIIVNGQQKLSEGTLVNVINR